MSHLKRSLILLVFYLAFIFNVENIPFNDRFFFHQRFFVELLVGVLLIVTLLLPKLKRLSMFFYLVFWIIIYAGVLFLLGGNDSLAFTDLPQVIIEIVILLIAAALARSVAIEMREIEGTLDRLVYSAFNERTLKIEEASEEIKVELTRSRRYQRPLTLVVIEPDQNTLREDLQPTLMEIQRNLARRYTMARISEILNREARRTDLIVKQDHPDRFILLCPETASSDSNTLIRRVQDAVHDILGVSVSWGVASFPEDGLTFEGLVNKARNKLLKPASLGLPVGVEQAEVKEKAK